MESLFFEHLPFGLFVTTLPLEKFLEEEVEYEKFGIGEML